MNNIFPSSNSIKHRVKETLGSVPISYYSLYLIMIIKHLPQSFLRHSDKRIFFLV